MGRVVGPDCVRAPGRRLAPVRRSPKGGGGEAAYNPMRAGVSVVGPFSSFALRAAADKWERAAGPPRRYRVSSKSKPTEQLLSGQQSEPESRAVPWPVMWLLPWMSPSICQATVQL